jgi:hypothetical protein
VRKKQSVRVVAIGAFGLYALSLQAEESPASVFEMTLDVDQRFGYDTNQGLTSGGEEDSKFATTQLTFGLKTESPIDSLSFTASSDFRFINGPDDPGTAFDVDNSALRLNYRRDTGGSALIFGTRYRRSDVDTTLPFSDFIDPNSGQIVLPTDLDKLNGTGTRNDLGFNGSLDLFKDAPFGLILNASHNLLTYSNTTDPSLARTERLNLGATVRLTFSPVLQGNINVEHGTFNSENIGMEKSFNNNTSFGLIYDASPILQYHGNIGYSVAETTEGIGIARMTTRHEGVSGSFGAIIEVPNGTISPEISSSIDTNGRRNTFDVGRVYELPNSSLSGSLGVTRGKANRTNVIGSLSFKKMVPNGDINTQFRRYVSNDSNDDERLYSALSVGYNHNINNASSILLSASFTTSNTINVSNSNSRVNASATYVYDLTKDWNISTGYIYRQEDDAASKIADSHSIFFGIGRRFDLHK